MAKVADGIFCGNGWGDAYFYIPAVTLAGPDLTAAAVIAGGPPALLWLGLAGPEPMVAAVTT